MSAGIRLYNEKSQVLVDSNYKNIALRQVIDLSPITRTDIKLGNRPVVIVEGLLPVNQIPSIVRLNYQNEYKAWIYNQHKTPQKLYIFGDPDNSHIDAKAGLIIYQNGTSEVAFDSRLQYLQIIGEVSNDMVLDPNKKYGIIRRIPFGENWYMWNKGRRNGKYYYVEKKWYEDYGVEAGKLKIFDRYTANYESFFIDGAAKNIDLRYHIKYKPLLVDLTSIV